MRGDDQLALFLCALVAPLCEPRNSTGLVLVLEELDLNLD